ncbi:MAG: putative phosphonate catabolism associated alcohol dehydrogenase [Pirellulaceae bacterium]|jgi:putative phosphonate catabolism associated alcohol dehydrogenase
MLRPRSDSCLAALFHQAGEPLRLQEVAIPKVESGEALVRVDCCTICGSDLHTITGARTEPTPSILGHEILGTVCEIGDSPLVDISGKTIEPGDRVTWSTCISCGECDRCSRGLPQKCRQVAKYGHEVAEGRYALSGGLAEYVLLRTGSAIAKVPDGVPDEVICPVNCATATVAAALRTAGSYRGKRILVMGAGMLGLTASAMAKSGGAAGIAVCDVNSHRLDFAERFGADQLFHCSDDSAEFQNQMKRFAVDNSFDVILELSGSPNAVECACLLADIGASIVLVGSVMPTRLVSLEPERIVRNWLSIQGVHNYAPQDLETAIAFLAASHGSYPFADLVEETFSLSEVNAAIDFALINRPIRVAVRP